MDGIIEVSGEANVALIAEVYFAAGWGVGMVVEDVVSLQVARAGVVFNADIAFEGGLLNVSRFAEVDPFDSVHCDLKSKVSVVSDPPDVNLDVFVGLDDSCDVGWPVFFVQLANHDVCAIFGCNIVAAAGECRRYPYLVVGVLTFIGSEFE